MSVLTINRAVAKYAAAHHMSRDVAMLAPVAALVGWLEAHEQEAERERLAVGNALADELEELRRQRYHAVATQDFGNVPRIDERIADLEAAGVAAGRDEREDHADGKDGDR